MSRNKQADSWAVSTLRCAGADIDQLMQSLPQEIAQLIDTPDQLTVDDLTAVLSECERLTGDYHFGLRLAEHSEISSMGVYGYLLLNAQTVGEFLEVASIYYTILYRTGEIRVTKKKASTRVEYRLIIPARTCSRHDTEWTLGYYVAFLRSKMGQNWHPLKVTFTHPKPNDISDLQRHFGSNLFFDQPRNSFEIDTAQLSFKISNTDPKLLQVIREHADILVQSIAQTECFESHVRLLIMNQLKQGPANAEYIARQLGLSLSTFKRRLTKNNYTFRALRDDVIKQLSQKALIETDLNISIIALQMGYSELSAFNHAFLRLCGMPPRAYRQKSQKTLSEN